MRGLLHQSLRYAAVGAVNTVIGLAAIYGLMFFFGADPATANAVGYAIGLAASFAMNHRWTFGSDHDVASLLPKYVFSVAVCYLLNLGTVLAAISWRSTDPYMAQLLGIAVYTVCLFFVCRRFVFLPASTGESAESS